MASMPRWADILSSDSNTYLPYASRELSFQVRADDSYQIIKSIDIDNSQNDIKSILQKSCQLKDESSKPTAFIKDENVNENTNLGNNSSKASLASFSGILTNDTRNGNVKSKQTTVNDDASIKIDNNNISQNKSPNNTISKDQKNAPSRLSLNKKYNKGVSFVDNTDWRSPLPDITVNNTLPTDKNNAGINSSQQKNATKENVPKIVSPESNCINMVPRKIISKYRATNKTPAIKNGEQFPLKNIAAGFDQPANLTPAKRNYRQLLRSIENISDDENDQNNSNEGKKLSDSAVDNFFNKNKKRICQSIPKIEDGQSSFLGICNKKKPTKKHSKTTNIDNGRKSNSLVDSSLISQNTTAFSIDNNGMLIPCLVPTLPVIGSKIIQSQTIIQTTTHVQLIQNPLNETAKKCSTNNSDEINDEEWKKRVSSRMKDIAIGKSTTGYQNYLRHVPKSIRNDDQPRTPDAKLKTSKAKFQSQLIEWRKSLHEFDNICD